MKLLRNWIPKNSRMFSITCYCSGSRPSRSRRSVISQQPPCLANRDCNSIPQPPQTPLGSQPSIWRPSGPRASGGRGSVGTPIGSGCGAPEGVTSVSKPSSFSGRPHPPRRRRPRPRRYQGDAVVARPRSPRQLELVERQGVFEHGQQRKCRDHPQDAADLRTCQKGEDHKERMHPHRVPHDVGGQNVAFELLDDEVDDDDDQGRDRRVEEGRNDRRDGPQEGSHVGDHLGNARPDAEQQGILPAFRPHAHHVPTQDPDGEPAGQADGGPQQRLTADPTAERGLQAANVVVLDGCLARGQAAQEAEDALAVDEHVEAHDDGQEEVDDGTHHAPAHREERAHRLGAVALQPVDDVGGVDLQVDLYVVGAPASASRLASSPLSESSQLGMASKRRWNWRMSGGPRKTKITTMTADEGQVDDGTASQRGTLDAAHRQDDGVEKQGHDRRDEKDEDGVTGDAAEVEGKEDRNRNQHQLDPSRYGDAHLRLLLAGLLCRHGLTATD